MKRNISDIILTSKEHLNQERQGLQSTKATIFQTDQDEIIKNITNLKTREPLHESLNDTIANEIQSDDFPLSDDKHIKTNEVVYTIINAEPKGKNILI